MGADPPSRDTVHVAKLAPTSHGSYTVALPTEMIEDWIAAPSMNCGVILETSNGAVGHLHLGSSEGPAENAPKLIVSYLP
jgi:hypothetical protein